MVMFGGEAVAHEEFDRLIHDFALLHSLGIRLVLVHGANPQIETALHNANLPNTAQNGVHITLRGDASHPIGCRCDSPTARGTAVDGACQFANVRFAHRCSVW